MLSGAMNPRTCSYRCESGRTDSSRSFSLNDRTPIIVVALDSRLPWLSIAPFGSPVVPLVNTISASMSFVTFAGSIGAARRAASGRTSTKRIGSPSSRADASVWRLAMTSFAPVWATIFLPKSIV